MQSPWRSLREPSRQWADLWPPTGVACLIAANALGFLAQTLLGLGNNRLEQWGALSLGGIGKGCLWQPVTCLFLHPGLWPLIAGTLVLWIAGQRLEAIMGRRHLFQLYLAGGAAGALGQILVNWLGHLHDSARPIASFMGSSPAALAVFVTLACIMPEWPTYTLGPLRLRARHLAVGAAAASAGLMTWDFQTGRMEQPAAAWLIGSLTGCLYARQLGFGQRVQAMRGAAPTAAASGAAATSLVHAPTLEKSAARQKESLASSASASGRTAAPNAVPPRFTESERRMSPRQYIAERIDPILDKISLLGIDSLTDEERIILEKGREKMFQQNSES